MSTFIPLNGMVDAHTLDDVAESVGTGNGRKTNGTV